MTFESISQEFRKTLDSPGTSPHLMWANASLLFLSNFKRKNRLGLLRRPYLTGISLIYYGVGYIISYDSVNGPLLATGWGGIYLMLCTPMAIQSRQFLPLALCSTIGVTTLLYLKESLD